VYPIGIPNIAFIGLPTVDGSLHPIAEKQSEWFASLMAGECILDTTQEMERDVLAWEESLEKYHVTYRPMQVQTSKYVAMIDAKMAITPT
jgi:hypothetical protein